MSDHDPGWEESVFSAASRLASPQERQAYLDGACGSDLDARRRIEDLLAVQDQLGGFMEATDGTARGPEVDFDLKPGARVGRYKLLEKLGEGGCGVVFMAEQEEPVRRRVALKVIKLGMDTRSVIARFEAERQALALMDHPHIARILDAGATETGRPYFVMELVRGVRITEFCNEHRLGIRERLDLFIQVCQAVQHAHQKGIIHRDLKPSNILVTVREPGSPGTPKIIDFGIAKATQGRLTDRTLFTAFEQFLGTPAYMSPEQAMMTEMDVDTRSDIYSLGVQLYELLTGRTPFDSRELLAAGLEAMRRTVVEKEPPRPSTRLSQLQAEERTTTARCRQTEAPKLVQLVRGDLDWIVMKCLEKDRARRYGTANALAADLQRYLANEPVTARPPSKLYVFRKAVRRHRVGFAAAVSVLVALAAGALLSAREAMRARRAEEATRRTAYVADMALADRSMNDGDPGTAQALLRRYVPKAHETDLRGWEWRYLTKLADGDPHVPLDGHASAVWSLHFLETNALVTAGVADWRTLVWDVRAPRPSLIATNRSGAGGVSHVSAVARSRREMIYRPAWDGTSTLRLVDLRSGNETALRDEQGATLQAEDPIRSLDVTSDERWLLVAAGARVRICDLNRRAWSGSIPAEAGTVTEARCSPDGRWLAVADSFGNLGLWDFPGRRKVGLLTNAVSESGDLRFSPDSRWLACCGNRPSTRIWNVESRTLAAELWNPLTGDHAAFSPDGRWLAIAGGDATIRICSTEQWGGLSRMIRGHTDRITSLAYSPDGRWLASGARNGEVKLWRTEEPHATPDHVFFGPLLSSPPPPKIHMAPDGSGFARIVTGAPSNGVAEVSAEIWTGQPSRMVMRISLGSSRPVTAALLPVGRGLVLGGSDGSLRIVGSRGEAETVVPRAHQGEVYLMDASLDGTTLVTKDNRDWQVRLWRLPDLRPLAELPGALHVHDLRLSEDGRRLAGITGPGDVGVWEVPSMTGPPMWHGVRAVHSTRASALSPDSRWLAAATADGGAFLWDLSTQRRTVLPRGQTEYTSLSFSRDGSRLAAGAAGGTARLFDTASGQAVLSVQMATGLQLAFTLDGERLHCVTDSWAVHLHAPKLDQLRFPWLDQVPSTAPPPYQGPNTDYERPDRPAPQGRKP